MTAIRINSTGARASRPQRHHSREAALNYPTPSPASCRCGPEGRAPKFRRPTRHGINIASKRKPVSTMPTSDLPLPSTGRGNEGEGWEHPSPRRFSPFPLCAFPISAVFCKTIQTPTTQPRATTATLFNSATPL